MIEARNLSKTFSRVEAVRDVSFRVEVGEAVGFLGPNGAGKTTTFRMLAGTLGPSSGQVLISGHRLDREPIRAKSQLGYMPEATPLYPEMTAREYLLFRAELRGIHGRLRVRDVSRTAERVRVESHLETRIGHLSKGYRRRVALADALLGNPPVLLLDEPTAGLDPNQVLEVRQLISDLQEDHAILMSTHVLSEVEATCSRVMVILEGQILFSGSLDSLRKETRGKTARLVARSSRNQLKACLDPVLGDAVLRYEADGPLASCAFELAESDLVSKAVSACCAAELDVEEAGPVRPMLNEAFAELTGYFDREG